MRVLGDICSDRCGRRVNGVRGVLGGVVCPDSSNLDNSSFVNITFSGLLSLFQRFIVFVRLIFPLLNTLNCLSDWTRTEENTVNIGISIKVGGFP